MKQKRIHGSPPSGKEGYDSLCFVKDGVSITIGTRPSLMAEA
jgi:hypothetical protein